MNQSNPKKPKLAWYENNKDYTGPIIKHLEKNFEVREFGESGEVEQEIIDYNPDIIIFDYHMPFKSGIEMFQGIKKKYPKFIPVFYTIWASDDVTRQKIINSGIEENAIMDKHMDCESFAQRINDYFERREKK